MTMHIVAQAFRGGAYVSVAGLLTAAGWVATRTAVAAPELNCRVKTVETVRVAEILDGGALLLSDGRRVLLSGVDVPREKGAKDGSVFAAKARASVAALLKGRAVTLSEMGPPSKNGWLRAQVFVDGRDWLQGAMVTNGLARVRTFPGGRECSHELLAREAAARSAKRGIWSAAEFAIRAPGDAPGIEGSFGLVQGRVESVANIGGRVFLNFGDDFRTDFTVHVKPESVKLFADAGINLDDLRGRQVRARGFVRERNGPQIDATVPEQLELLP